MTIIPGRNGINTFSLVVNTSESDFRPEMYYIGTTDTYAFGTFTLLKKSDSSRPWIAADPVSPATPGDTITFHGTTNLPAGEEITTRVFEARYKCTKCQRKNNSVDGCCGDQIPRTVTVMPGSGGINTWSREVNTSLYDFSTGDYQIDFGDPSRGIWNSSGFTLQKNQKPAGPWITVDPVSRYYIGENIIFTGTTNLQPGESIRMAVYSAEFAPCPKSSGNCQGNVTPCCGGYSAIVSVLAGSYGTDTWSWTVDTSQHGFLPDRQYFISASGRNGAVENFSIFTVSGIPKSNITLNLPANDPEGNALRFSGQANTENGPEEILFLTVSSDSGKKVSFTVPVVRNGTGYSWNFSLTRSAINPYNFLTVNVSSQTSPAISIERTFLYNNEPAYYPYDPVGP